MFAVNFYASCFVSRGNSIGKEPMRLDWEKAVYRPLFTLANTRKTQSLNRYRRIPCRIKTWKNTEWGRVLLFLFWEKRHHQHPQLWEHWAQIKTKHAIEPHLNALWTLGVLKSFFRGATLTFSLNALALCSPVKRQNPWSVVHNSFPRVEATITHKIFETNSGFHVK